MKIRKILATTFLIMAFIVLLRRPLCEIDWLAFIQTYCVMSFGMYAWILDIPFPYQIVREKSFTDSQFVAQAIALILGVITSIMIAIGSVCAILKIYVLILDKPLHKR